MSVADRERLWARMVAFRPFAELTIALALIGNLVAEVAR